MSNKNKQSKQVSKSYSGASSLSKKVDNDEDGCPKINIDLKLESDILSFIRSTVSHHTSNGENRASHRLTKKRITDMYDILVQTGFNKESIELAMSQCLPVGGDLISLLDWLCLNTKDEDLPENFSQVLKEEEQKLKPKIFVEETGKIKPKPKPEILKKKQQTDEQPSMKDWILKYAETQDSDDDDNDDEEGDDNERGSSLKMSGGNKSYLDDELNERFISLVANYFDLKSSKGKQDEMQRLLDELKVLRSKPGFDQRNKRLLNLDSETRSPSGEDDEGLGVGGLFICEESLPNKVEGPAKVRPSKDFELRDLSYTRQQWTGKSPKQFFIDWMRKKMQSCSFSLEKVDVGGGKWRSKCILKRPAKEGGDLAVCPEIVCNNIKDAEHLACTLLLYTLCKDKDLHLLLPLPYRDVWLDWKKAEKEKVAVVTKEVTKDRDAFVDKLYNKVNSGKQAKKADATCIESWEDLEDEDDEDEDETCTSSQTSKRAVDRNRDLVSECRRILESNRKSKQFQDLLPERESLPVHGFKQTILDAFRGNEVFIVAGETGSGKSTQVPQFILEELLTTSSSSSPFIVCTEPRRISAVSLSHRVSAEMGERAGPGAPRSLCGYQIRSEVKRSPHTRLLFCTTGVLLRKMQGNMKMGDVGCVIVDEVHERDLNTDVLLIHLLELLTNQQRVQGSKLKVILMSATLDCNKFSKYFFNCPIVSVQGRSHHVEVLHLENIIELTKYQLESDSPYSLPYEDIVQEESTTLKVTGKGGDIRNIDVTWSKEDLFRMDRSGLDPKKFSIGTRNTVTRMNQEAINLDLIVETLRWLLVDGVNGQNDKKGAGLRGREGSVLMFLPGLAAIDEVREVMNSDPAFGDPSRFLILPLHSVLSSKEQSLVFSTPPTGVRKVILSTNIAETGLTIPDVVYVIDCGREKQKRYLDSSRISQLRQVWISQASARQRQGRAGRVRPGVCFRLFTSARYTTMSPQGLPEMKRLPLQGLCLHIMECYSRPVPEVLSNAIDPPNPSSISTAMSILREVGACIGNVLTPLGHHLAKLPLDAKLGKILIYAGVLGCLEDASLMVSCMTEKSPFQSRLEREEYSDSGRNHFNLYGSDQIATLLAVKRCLALKSKGERLVYCRKNAMKFDVIRDIENNARELKELVTECGLNSSVSDLLKSDPSLLRSLESSSDDPKRATVSLLKAVLVAGLWPDVGRLAADEKSGGRKKGSAEVRLASGEVAVVHGSSVNRRVMGDGWIVFLDKEKQNRLSLLDTTLVTEIPLLLFGGEIQVQHQQHRITIDDWIKFKAPAKTGVLMKELKMRLDDFLDRKLHNPSLDVSIEPILPLLIRLLVSDGKQQLR